MIDLLEQRKYVMVRENLNRSYGYLMIDDQALVEAQCSPMFFLPSHWDGLVTNIYCLIDAHLTFSRGVVFVLLYSPAMIDIRGN